MRISDWSSDVCSSDLHPSLGHLRRIEEGIIFIPCMANMLRRDREAEHGRISQQRIEKGSVAPPQQLFHQALPLALVLNREHHQIGSTSCRERRCKYVQISVGTVYVKKTDIQTI